MVFLCIPIHIFLNELFFVEDVLLQHLNRETFYFYTF